MRSFSYLEKKNKAIKYLGSTYSPLRSFSYLEEKNKAIEYLGSSYSPFYRPVTYGQRWPYYETNIPGASEPLPYMASVSAGGYGAAQGGGHAIEYSR